MSDVRPYRYFFALPPETGGRLDYVAYLFIVDAQGRFACQNRVGEDVLEMLPRIFPAVSGAEFLNDSAPKLRRFALVSSEEQVCSSEDLQLENCRCEQKALCWVGAKEDCSEEWLARLGFVDRKPLSPQRVSDRPALSELCWQSFRSLILFCPEWQIGLLARAKELVYFSQEYLFCCRCGRPLEWLEGEFGKSCASCARVFFPRQDPSIISLVCRKANDGSGREWLLLAHNKNFRPQLYSLIAGFVDAGETLEQAVVREVWEEAGVRLSELRYMYSQAWAEPHALMAGFLAYGEGGGQPDGKEILSLLWLERADILRCLEQRKRRVPNRAPEGVLLLSQCRENYELLGKVDTTGFCLPQRGSIACKLIEQWAYFPESF
ncbi:MAG: NAD(+) diphosphatase [Spirochaetota bacterium]